MKDYYKILGIQFTASIETIKKAYRIQSKKYHPDINPNGTEQFKSINEANNTLSDPDKRKAYDIKYKAIVDAGKNSNKTKSNNVTKNASTSKHNYHSTNNNGGGSTIIVNGVKINVTGNNTTTNVKIVNGKVIIETSSK
jgi:curved DNA-binding protein CbpA